MVCGRGKVSTATNNQRSNDDDNDDDVACAMIIGSMKISDTVTSVSNIDRATAIPIVTSTGVGVGLIPQHRQQREVHTQHRCVKSPSLNSIESSNHHKGGLEEEESSSAKFSTLSPSLYIDTEI